MANLANPANQTLQQRKEEWANFQQRIEQPPEIQQKGLFNLKRDKFELPEQRNQNEEQVFKKRREGGGDYIMYNNKRYKIYTGKRGGKYICVGVEKKKIYI